MGTLYLVATPIGNLEDITLRALRTFSDVALVAAEDTRTTRKLLTHHGIKQRLISYNEHNMKQRTPRLLSALEGGDVAFASDAGTPGVSDPGFELARAAVEAGHEVVAIPGASSLLTALSASGLPMRGFTFVAFLPRRIGERRRLLESLATNPQTIVFFESPRRLLASLSALREALGDRRVAVCRELTKLHEEIFRGTITEALIHFTEPRGEFTVVVEGATVKDVAARAPAALRAASLRLAEMRATGIKAREAVRVVAEEMGLSHRDVYTLWLDTGGKRPRG